MTLTIHSGWWLLPASITAAAFAKAAWLDRDNKPSGDYGFAGIASAFVYGGALIVSLLAWLVWALVR